MLNDKEFSILGKKKSQLDSFVFTNEKVAELFISIVPQAMRIFREEMRSHRSGAMSVPQFRILAQLWLQPTGNKSLAERLGVSGAAMSRMVDSLVNAGYVERHTNKADRRSISIRLTKKGLVYFEKIRSSAISSLARRLSDLDESIVDQMGAGFGLISRAMVELQRSGAFN